MQLEAEFKKIEKQFQVKYEELVDLYNRMVLFQIDIEKHGGMRVYEKSAITTDFRLDLNDILHIVKGLQCQICNNYKVLCNHFFLI
ncbi:ATPase involved in DNA repair [Bacillus cereus]|nr:ATPase involved in DNA repair [Bacillus cereus]